MVAVLDPKPALCHILAKQLKLPTFVTYREQLRQADPSADIGEILLMLMKTELEQRQENQNLRRLKQAGFPYTKTIEELDISRYKGDINSLPCSCPVWHFIMMPFIAGAVLSPVST